jgi:hypothetical protein
MQADMTKLISAFLQLFIANVPERRKEGGKKGTKRRRKRDRMKEQRKEGRFREMKEGRNYEMSTSVASPYSV